MRRPGSAVDSLAGKGAEICAADLENEPALTASADGVEIVLQTAALASYVASPQQIEQTNILGTRNILKAAGKAGIKRFVHVSSESITLTNSDRIEEDESEPFPRRFLAPYSRSKARAERDISGQKEIQVF